MDKTKQEIYQELQDKELDLLIKEKQENIRLLEQKFINLEKDITEKETIKKEINEEIVKEQNKVLTESEEVKTFSKDDLDNQLL